MLLNNFLSLFLEAAPFLLLGLVIAGLLKMFMPMDWMQRQLGGNGISAIIKAALLGAPLPLCSCGVIPAAVGLRRAGASKAATTSFLIATPETGVDSIGVSYALLGPFMAIARPIAAISSAIVAGMLIGNDEVSQKNISYTKASIPEKKQNKSCCSSHQQTKQETLSNVNTQTSFFNKIVAGLKYAVNNIIRDTATWLLVGLFFAAVMETYIPTEYMSSWGDGILAMTAMIIISTPMYICATASTPIAAGLIATGISPGAVLVFMLAGPATNIATIGVVHRELGKKAVLAYLTGVMGVALLFGVIVNYLVDTFDFKITAIISNHYSLVPDFVTHGSGVILFLLMARVYWKKWVA